MGKRIEVKIGKRYERLVILGEAPQKNGCRRFYCECDCGNITISRLGCLRSGESKSCGCLKTEIFIKKNTKHGLTKRGVVNKLHNVWQSMRQRCFNPKCIVYSSYGGRGITVCDEWMDYKVFHKWAILNGYQQGLSIERINNNGNYETDNCTWIPMSEQSKNKRRSIRVTVNGIKFQTLTDAAKHFNVNVNTAYGRFKKGLNIDQVMGL